MAKRWSKKDLVEAVKSSRSIRQVIIRIGLVPAGGNYAQVKKYIDKYKINTDHFLGKGWNRGYVLIQIPKLNYQKY